MLLTTAPGAHKKKVGGLRVLLPLPLLLFSTELPPAAPPAEDALEDGAVPLPEAPLAGADGADEEEDGEEEGLTGTILGPVHTPIMQVLGLEREKALLLL